MPAIYRSQRRLLASLVLVPIWTRSSLVTCANDLPTASAVTRRPLLYRHNPRGPASGGGKSEGNPGCQLSREFHAYFLPAFVSTSAGLLNSLAGL
jgi:hypothetical protein